MPKQYTEEDILKEDIPTRSTKNKVYKSEKAKKAAERKDYIPLVDPKHTTEIIVKPKPKIDDLITIEKPGKKTKRKTRKKTKSSTKTKKTS